MRRVCGLIVAVLWGACLAGCATPQERSSGSSAPSAPSVESWFTGGTLHRATVGEWKSATHQNKLATAADWLVATRWKGHMNSLADADRIKPKAEALVNAVDGAVNAEGIDTMKVNEVAAAIITLSNDLGP